MPAEDLDVTGFRPPDEKWQEMKKVWDACASARIRPPKEVTDFFNNERPDSKGVEIDLNAHKCRGEYSRDMVDGVEIDLTKLPEGITLLRFTMTY